MSRQEKDNGTRMSRHGIIGHCSVCNQPGHNKRKCPELGRGQPTTTQDPRAVEGVAAEHEPIAEEATTKHEPAAEEAATEHEPATEEAATEDETSAEEATIEHVPATEDEH